MWAGLGGGGARAANREQDSGSHCRSSGWFGIGQACAVFPAASRLMAFVEDSIDRGSLIHTDGWPAYDSAKSKGYHHRVTVLSGKKKSASELLPRVHRVSSLLKRWRLRATRAQNRRDSSGRQLDEHAFRLQSAEAHQFGVGGLVVLPACSRAGGRGPCALQADGQVFRAGERSKPPQVVVT